jgi:hypothetical protein
MEQRYMYDKHKPWYPNMDGDFHVGVHFGKRVEVYTTAVEHCCVVHHPDDASLTASWRMPKELSALQAAALAAFKTEEQDYDRKLPECLIGSFPPKAS